ncbi:hypothetical protein HPB50_023848 [Hyalomma asiaticum]|uniref:Uncharacterized protein n=1 Tax=Hyalomma asiaticum TaxID=266040 RepID=A0ACB7S306_HYAAI|nr:hypothetical protein HPB50_023848 [Hyalomma asiaticum]
MTLSNGLNPVFFSRGCVERKGEPLIGKHSELRNTVIRAACIDPSHLRPANDKPNCNSYQSDVIFDAIKFYNVTVVQMFYPNALALIRDMFEGTVDVHRNLARPKAAAIRDFNVPGVITYMHESFYVKRKGSVMLSLLDIGKDSKYPLMLISTALILSLTFLALANGYSLRRITANDVSDSFMFLLAAVHATSYTVPRVGRWSVLGGMICGLWLMGMLPFANYFRGEVMARLTFRAFPEHMNTLEELERALDERRVAPCVVKDTLMHYRLTTDHSDDSIHKKLRLVFMRHTDRDNLIKWSYGQCLMCALREDRICYTVSLPSWFHYPYKQMIVESKEHLSPILLTFTVRLNYPHKFALREVISKVIESGLMLPPEDTRRAGYLQNYEQTVSFEWSKLRLEELTSFLLLFISLLAFATVVCALEIIVHASISIAKGAVPDAAQQPRS